MIRKLIIAGALAALVAAFVGVNIDIRGDRTGVNIGFAYWHGSMAQSVFGPFTLTCTNANAGCAFNVDATDPAAAGGAAKDAISVKCTFNDLGAATGYTDQVCEHITFAANDGQNAQSSGAPNTTVAKRTFLPLFIEGEYFAAGQKFLYENRLRCYGMGDCGLWSNNRIDYAGGPVGGDEGTSWQTASGLNQQSHLTTGTITGAARSSCNTTTTQVVTGGYAAQAVTVASTTGCVVNDWIVLGQTLPSGDYGYPNDEAVQVTAVNSGVSVSGIFKNNHPSAETVTPALVLNLNTGAELGQQRKIVNLSGSSYSTGTVASISGHTFTGSGTTWTAGMVGGGTTNIGCISLANDVYSGPAPNGDGFNGSGNNGPLNSWYEITSVANSTTLTISSFSTSGNEDYTGRGVGSGGYIVRPCAEVLRVYGNGVITESTASTWSIGHNVEIAISPYPDVAGYQNYMAMWTPGGQHRGFMFVRNNGARKFGYGFSVESPLQVGSNADTTGFAVAYNADTVDVGLYVSNAATAAVQLPNSNPSGAIAWGTASNGTFGSTYIVPNVTNGGLDFQLDADGSLGDVGFLHSYGHNSGILGPNNTMAGMTFGGALGTAVHVVADLPTCAPGAGHNGYEGMQVAISNSNTATFAATISGTGSNHVIAYCDGTNWTVH